MTKTLTSVLLASLLAMFVNFNANALGSPLGKGTISATAALGFQPGMGASLSSEYVLVDSWWEGHFAVGLGIQTVAISSEGLNYSILPKATYGIFLTDAIEVHAGIQLGFGHNKNRGNGFAYGGLLGGRYFFNDTMAAGLELNYTGWGAAYTPFVSLGYTILF